jgi:hypothetical protein
VIVYRKKGIRVAECWFGESPVAAGPDLVRCFQRAAPDAAALCRAYHTVLIDLRRPTGALFGAIRKSTRYEIRRSGARDELTWERWNGEQGGALGTFCAFYDRFAAQKGLRGVNRQWLSLLAGTGGLELSRISRGPDDPLVWHAYYRSNGRAVLLHSASLFRGAAGRDRRQLVGRANRLHHWQDLVWFRAAGESTYDLGGWYAGGEDQERLRVNWFKAQFGGSVVREFVCEYPLTVKGRLFLRIRRWLVGDAF